MKPSASLKSDFKKHFSRIKDLLKKNNREFGVEDFHQLRVEIKKLRADLKLLDSCSKKFKEKKYFKPFRNIFDQAGKIRELQLEADMIHKHDPNHALQHYLNNLSQQVQDKKRSFFSMVRNGNTGKLKKTYRRVVPFIKAIQKNDVKKYVKEKKKEISSLQKQPRLKTAQVHELRKGLKRFYYNLKSLHVKNHKKELKNGDALQDRMGKWHDYRVANRHLLKMANEHKTTLSELPAVRKVAHRIFSKSQVLYQKINDEKEKQII